MDTVPSDDDTRRRFFSLRSFGDVADLLGISPRQLRGHLYSLRYGVDELRLYTAFKIPKKTGGARTITAPTTTLKRLQRALNTVLQMVYEPPDTTHGFTLARSIVSNAAVHARQRYVLNVDLENFFPSINFQRVRGLFRAAPYSLPDDVATILAKLCVYQDQLPQGAPTSPTVSNMICVGLDHDLFHLARAHGCRYTRYADDITFSTGQSSFPDALAVLDPLDERVLLDQQFVSVINNHGFRINQRKVRLKFREKQRLEVTGLTANERPNVRRSYIRTIRAMLYDWEQHGLEHAEARFLSEYDRSFRQYRKSAPSFVRVLAGRIAFLGMVRGKDDAIFLRYREQLQNLLTMIPPVQMRMFVGHTIIANHLTSALDRLRAQMLYQDLKLEISALADAEVDDDEAIEAACARAQGEYHRDPTVFLFFNRNRPNLEANPGRRRLFDFRGDNVYTLTLPIPAHHESGDVVQIEHFYTDRDLQRTDPEGCRLFLSSEFHPRSGRHLLEDLNCTLLDLLRDPTQPRIIASDVYNRNHEEVALTRAAFARQVRDGAAYLVDLDISAFGSIFALLVAISDFHERRTNGRRL